MVLIKIISLIGETVEFVVEKGKAVLYPHRGKASSVSTI
jgi:hypothetical protein